MQVNALLGVQARRRQRQSLGIAATEVFGQVYPVVGALALFTEHPQLEATQGIAFDQLLNAVMANHAVADNDQFFPRGDGHCCIHTRSSLKAIHGGAAAGASPEKQKRRLEPKLQAPLPGRFMQFRVRIAIDPRERCKSTKAGSVPTARNL
ncbi:hypothetical protein D3C80_354080 [compost metagenome]